MRRKRLLFWSGIALLLLALTITTLLVLLYHEPAFYARAHVPPGKERRDTSNQFFAKLCELGLRFKDAPDSKQKPWIYKFAAEQINSYLEEEFQRGNLAEELARRGIWSPRLAIEADRIRLAFRYGNDWWSTVVSLDFRVWLVPKEINVVALEILGRRAGALPISAQLFLDQVVDMARKKNVEVTLYRHYGNPVALLRFQSDRLRPTAQLLHLELRPSMITVGGAPLEVMQQVQAPAPSLRID